MTASHSASSSSKLFTVLIPPGNWEDEPCFGSHLEHLKNHLAHHSPPARINLCTRVASPPGQGYRTSSFKQPPKHCQCFNVDLGNKLTDIAREAWLAFLFLRCTVEILKNILFYFINFILMCPELDFFLSASFILHWIPFLPQSDTLCTQNGVSALTSYTKVVWTEPLIHCKKQNQKQ